ncbi:MAG: type II secretion system F family protein [Halofilum sp. (in: g-proteobacteria)]|nr:type II secretion system F family protein [Halofilum sp. (in: g-proteobacteria)]
MPRFEYQGRDRAGARTSGIIDAGSLDSAAGQLMELGITPLDIRAGAQPKSDSLRRRLGMDRPRRVDVIMFARQMYTITRSGVPLIQGLTRLAESTRNPVMRETIEAIIDDLESGRELGGALARHPSVFSPLFVSMVRVGESSGRLEESFERMYLYLERETDTIQRIKSAVRYPAIVVVAMLAAIMVLMTFVVPVFARVFERFNTELPLPTQILISVSGFFANFWWAILLAAVLGFVAFRRWINTEEGALSWGRRKLGIPVVGSILLRGTLARFARALSMAQRSGVPILEALNVVASAVDNAWVTRKILAMREGIEHGEALSRTAARSDVFTPLVIQMLTIGEETGRIDEMVDEVAEFYEREVAYDVQNLSTLIEPVLTIGLAILVFILALGIFLPLWDLGQAALGGR